MGKVAAVFKVYTQPDSFEKVLEKVKELAKDVEVEEVGFGIKILKVLMILEETADASDKAEEKLRGIPGVTEVELESSTRL